MADALSHAITGDTVAFNLATSGGTTISQTVALPSLTQGITIDGTTQPGFVSSPLLRLDGGRSSNNGLTLAAPGITVRGLIITRFAQGIHVSSSASGAMIEGNFIGVLPNGTSASNSQAGIFVDGANGCLIGGTGGTGGNVISGNASGGIWLNSGASGNIVAGNIIGLLPDGSAALVNGDSSATAIAVLNGSSHNVIGGDASIAGNVIVGGINVAAPFSDPIIGTLIENNTIGLSRDGRSGLGGSGIILNSAAQNTLIAENTIAGVQGAGVFAQNASNVGLICGNFIGTNGTTGGTGLGTSDDGVFLENVSNWRIGPSGTCAGNVIANNAKNGIQIAFGGQGNDVGANDIQDNGGLGIELGGFGNNEGVTFNDVGDADLGPNGFQNFPLISNVDLASQPGKAIVSGTLDGTANTVGVRIDIYGNASCDPSGHGEGQGVLGSTNVNLDNTGHAVFSFLLDPAPPFPVFAATATSPRDGTSEFGPCFPPSNYHPGTLRLAVSTAAAPEGAGKVNVTVQRIDGRDGAVSVGFAFFGQTATLFDDFNGTPGRITFVDGDTADKTFSFEVVQDTLVEGDETLLVQLQDTLGGAALVDPITAVYTIVDDDVAPAPTVTVGMTTNTSNGVSSTSAPVSNANNVTGAGDDEQVGANDGNAVPPAKEAAGCHALSPGPAVLVLAAALVTRRVGGACRKNRRAE